MTSAARRPFAESLYRIATAVRANLLFDAIKPARDRKSTRLNSSHLVISYAVFCLKKKKEHIDFSSLEIYMILTSELSIDPLNSRDLKQIASDVMLDMSLLCIIGTPDGNSPTSCS